MKTLSDIEREITDADIDRAENVMARMSFDETIFVGEMLKNIKEKLNDENLKLYLVSAVFAAMEQFAKDHRSA